MNQEKIVVLTGAGISAESGIKTFRDNDGLWENYDISEVATPEAWERNPALVLDFYNQRRRQVQYVQPNAAHQALCELEQYCDLHIITQNIDDLHERAGSTQVIHLHGELLKVRSSVDEELVYEWRDDVQLGDTCARGSQLRPHVVWFGEMVPMMEVAATAVSTADRVIIVGTSMQVYPAASLVGFAPAQAQIYYVDPRPSINYELSQRRTLRVLEDKASRGVPDLVQQLIPQLQATRS